MKGVVLAYNVKLADRIREYLLDSGSLEIEEKKMFGGLAFLVNGKMCVNVSGENLMVRFDPGLQDEISKRKGFEPMFMNGKLYKGYGYVHPEQIKKEEDFNYWMNLSLAFNKHAKSSRKR